MQKGRDSDQQIALALQQVGHGATVVESCRKLGISEQTFSRWKKKFVGRAPSEIKKLRQLKDENQRLKQLVADLTLEKQTLHEVLQEKTEASRRAMNRCGRSASSTPTAAPAPPGTLTVNRKVSPDRKAAS